jgi:hypothetical protein
MSELPIHLATSLQSFRADCVELVKTLIERSELLKEEALEVLSR